MRWEITQAIYKQSRINIASFFENTLITENILVENSLEVGHALEWYKLGADFADAMHLCICGESLLHTYDGKFCKTATELGITPAFKVLS